MGQIQIGQMMDLQARLKETTEFIDQKTKLKPLLGITLGSGLGDFAKHIKIDQEIPYSEIPHFLPTTVAGHSGKLILGELEGKPVACLQGRIHAYEGHGLDQVAFPTRVLKSLGCEYLILTNAAGGINTNFHAGSLVMIEDHINLTGNNPLLGPNHDFLGTRFPDMSETYNRDLQKIIQNSSEAIDYKLEKGIYAGVLGPTYETPAEVRMLRTLGADMVGMSTVPEAIAAHHAGLKVGAISCITNMASGIEKTKLKHEDIKDQAMLAQENFTKLLCQCAAQL